MRKNIEIKVIGRIEKGKGECMIQLDPQYRKGLTELKGFSHLQVIWWGHLCDTPEWRDQLELGKLFINGPDNVGSFATRSPVRPNPIMVSIIRMSAMDPEHGNIYTPFIDAEVGTPVLDIKPYMRMERVKDCRTPAWCSDLPEWQEEAAKFDWSKVIQHPDQKSK